MWRENNHAPLLVTARHPIGLDLRHMQRLCCLVLGSEVPRTPNGLAKRGSEAVWRSDQLRNYPWQSSHNAQPDNRLSATLPPLFRQIALCMTLTHEYRQSARAEQKRDRAVGLAPMARPTCRSTVSAACSTCARTPAHTKLTSTSVAQSSSALAQGGNSRWTTLHPPRPECAGRARLFVLLTAIP